MLDRRGDIVAPAATERRLRRATMPGSPAVCSPDAAEISGGSSEAIAGSAPEPAVVRPPLARAPAGVLADDWSGKPVIAILNTWSDANPCHAHFRLRADDVKRGVWQAGGFPLEIPAAVARRDVHEADHDALSQPAGDGGRGSCCAPTRSTASSCSAAATRPCPACVMGATSANLPAIFVPAGPMLRGNWRGQVLGSGSDVWKYWAEQRAGHVDDCTLARDRGRHRPLVRHVHDDGHGLDDGGGGRSARADAAGRLVDPGGRLRARPHGRRRGPAHRRDGRGRTSRPRDILTTAAFDNAVAATMALGGSTNAIIHLIAMAGRAGVALELERFDALVAADAAPRQHPAVRAVPDGGLPLRGRPARRCSPGCAIIAPRRLHDRERHARSARDSTDAVVCNDDVIARRERPLAAGGRRGRAARQPRAGRRGHQAHGGGAAAAASTPGRPWSSATTTTSRRGSTTRTCR